MSRTRSADCISCGVRFEWGSSRGSPTIRAAFCPKCGLKLAPRSGRVRPILYMFERPIFLDAAFKLRNRKTLTAC